MIWIALLFTAIFIAVVFVLLQQTLGRMFKNWEERVKTDTTRKLQDFFLFIDPSALWSGNVVLSLLLAVITWVLSSLWWLGVVLGLLVFVAPNWLVARMRRRRLAQFDGQLPAMLLALAGALRAGAGVQAAIGQITMQAAAPLSQEFGLVQRQQRLGVSFEQSLDDLFARMPSESTGLLVSALKIANQSGGNLAEALERIAQTLQARQQIQGRIRALTSQGKMQAWVMAGLPLLLMVVLNMLDPAAMSPLWFHPAGWTVLVIIFMLEALGIWLILKIVNIDI
ncbi:type II secretion system F family protein [Advenella mimigardefordensis]|uniref:Type II secretion system F domain-containing protein n=1 Tax=Advenella mimigardefordensis (strain DSM 17166 / LMG 22922 / DPN7) TaxID=1247726 RepID=W0PE37_ADVMD|nr:type II secretion system F family protein [Advenella mimigardefordensis]AHG63712.1 type II secretion system F domain-containing protein [Advenella mimigardefordensis DPN7]